MATITAEMPTPGVQGELATRTGSGVPMFVSADGDLVAKPGSNQDSWFYLFGLDSSRGRLNLLVHVLQITPPGSDGVVQALVSLLDPKTSEYISEEGMHQPADSVLSTERLEVRTPNGELTGDSADMHVSATFQRIQADLHLTNRGPLMACMGTGLFPLLGDINYEYAITDLATTGTVTIDGETVEVEGSCWLDRQWGITPRFFDQANPIKWIWMGIQLDDGDRISLAEVTEAGRRHTFATVVRPNGAHEVVAVEPLEANASDPWTSAATGNVYPTTWRIDIPELDGALTIETDVQQQEVVSAAGLNKYEGAARIAGRLRGEDVSGHVTVELVGAWR